MAPSSDLSKQINISGGLINPVLPASVSRGYSYKHGCHRLERKRRRPGGRGQQTVRQTYTDCRFEFRYGTITVIKQRQAAGCIWTHSWRGFSPRLDVVVLTIAAFVK